MSTLLISVGSSSFKGAMWGKCDFDFPLNVGYVASYLEQNNFKTDVFDLQFFENSVEKFFLKKDIKNYEFIGLSSNLTLYKEVYKLAEYLKIKNSKLKIFVFGPIGLYLKKEILKTNEFVDYVIFGEEETTILDLIKNWKLPNEIKGICYRSNFNLEMTEEREYLSNLDLLPFPAREKFNMKKYFPTPGKYYVLPQLTMISSRGCNNHCLFCPNVSGNKLRFRSAENILEEIDILVNKYNAKEICFLDELFGFNNEEICKLAELIIKNKYKFYLRICTRIDSLEPNMLKLLKRAGLYSVGIGIESGSDKILKYNNKNITIKEIEKAVKMLKQLNLEIRGYFMLNLPAETKKTILETFLFIEKLNVDLVNIQIAYPYPNTSFRKLAEKKYKLKYNKWDNWEYSDGDDVVFLQNNLTEEYILTYYNKIIKNNFLNLKFIINWMKRIKSFHDFKYSFYQFLNLISNNK